MLMGTSHELHQPEMYTDLPYDPAKDLVPVAMVGGVGSILYVRNSLDVRSFQQLLERARQKPGELTYGSPAMAVVHCHGLLETMAKVRMTHIPYRGTAPATADAWPAKLTCCAIRCRPRCRTSRAGGCARSP